MSFDKAKEIEKLNQKLEEAQKADGFFITVSTRQGKTLSHYQIHMNFKEDDLIPSLEEVMKLVKGNNPGLQIPKINPFRKFN